MIEYLYTTEFRIQNLEKVKDHSLHTCTHDERFHTLDKDTCFLAPYAFIVDMYTLGDKYDIPGLRAKAYSYLKERFDLDRFDDWDDDLAVWEYTYQHTRKTEELWALLVNKITTDFIKSSLGEFEEFYAFVARYPEIAEILLKASHEQIGYATTVTKSLGLWNSLGALEH